jgi:hypothetical protein
MVTEKASKNCVVRFSELLHHRVKFQAFKEGKTIQGWMTELVEEKLNSKESGKWLCQVCGDWKLEGTQMALQGQCENCKRKEVTTFWVKQ